MRSRQRVSLAVPRRFVWYGVLPVVATMLLLPIAASSGQSQAAGAPPAIRPATQPAESPASAAVLVTGSVVDDQGRAIEGAAVQLKAWDSAKNAMVTKHEIRSARDGSFSMSVPAWVYRGLIVAGKEGFAHDWAWFPPSQRPPFLRLKLEKPAAIAGCVVDGGGSPIPGAEVTAVIRGTGEMADCIGQTNCLPWLAAKSDDQGRFKLSGLPPRADGMISALARGFWQQDDHITVKTGREGVMITMFPGGRIKGKVIDADTGKPLAGIRMGAGELVGRPGRTHRGGSGVSDEKGLFVIDGLPEGECGISMNEGVCDRCDWLPMDSVSADVKVGMTTDVGVVKLHKGVPLEVQVLDAVSGRPVVAAEVGVIDTKGQLAGIRQTLDDGMCRLRLPDSMSPKLRITEGSYKGFLSEPVEVLKGQVRRVVFRLERDKWVTGKVLNPDGSGAVGVTVGLYPKFREQYGTTGDDGSFELALSPVATEDRGSAIVVARDVKRNLAGWLKLDAGRPVEIRLSQGVTLSGQVIDDKGKPLPGASLQVLTQAKNDGAGGSGFDWNVVSDPDGRFEIKAVAPGLKYAIDARAAGHEGVKLVVDVPAGASGRDVKVEPMVMRVEGL